MRANTLLIGSQLHVGGGEGTVGAWVVGASQRVAESVPTVDDACIKVSGGLGADP